MKQYSPSDHPTLAKSAARWAERVLPLFGSVHPRDLRPQKAIEACRTWVRTGVFSMKDIRGASLAAHAAARAAKPGSAACFAARAAGQAVATAHVAQHAFGSAYYALKAVIEASDPARAESRALKERDRQAKCLPEHLRSEFLDTITIRKGKKKTLVRIKKGKGF